MHVIANAERDVAVMEGDPYDSNVCMRRTSTLSNFDTGVCRPPLRKRRSWADMIPRKGDQVHNVCYAALVLAYFCARSIQWNLGDTVRKKEYSDKKDMMTTLICRVIKLPVRLRVCYTLALKWDRNRVTYFNI